MQHVHLLRQSDDSANDECLKRLEITWMETSVFFLQGFSSNASPAERDQPKSLQPHYRDHTAVSLTYILYINVLVYIWRIFVGYGGLLFHQESFRNHVVRFSQPI